MPGLENVRNVLRSPLLTWIQDVFGGTMGTRHYRLNWRTNKCKTVFLDVKAGKQFKYNDICAEILKPGSLAVNFEIEAASKSKLSLKIPLLENDTCSKNCDREGVTTYLESLLNNAFSSLTSLHRFDSLRGESLERFNMLVEYGSPNIAKPFHLGHLRSTVTGHYVSRICALAGHNVMNACFLGDWGTQFGILQAGLLNTLQEGDRHDLQSFVEAMSLKDLLGIYVESVKRSESDSKFQKTAQNCSLALEKLSPDNLILWEIIRKKTLDHLNELWHTLGIRYQLIEGESEFAVHNDLCKKVISMLEESKVTKHNPDGLVAAVLEKDEKFPKEIILPLLKADGGSLYLTRDLACAFQRETRFKFDKVLYVVDKTQTDHFYSLFRLLSKLGVHDMSYPTDKWEQKLRHIRFGQVKGMSTRAGNFVLLSQVLEEGIQLMKQARAKSRNTREDIENESVNLNLAISGLIAYSLKYNRNKDIEFNWEKALNPSGDSGVKLQYTYARLCSLQKACSNIPVPTSQELDIKYIANDSNALNLVVQILNFEDTFWSSYTELEPCLLVTYSFLLCNSISKALTTMKVLSEPNQQTASTKLYIFMLAKTVMGMCMHTLGIHPMEKI